jgi:uracil-DNA glycosylase
MLERVLIVGEAPSKRGARALHPDDCASGRRLLAYTGWTRDEYESTGKANLFAQPQPRWDAAEAASSLKSMPLCARDEFVVCLGKRVMLAVGFKTVPWLTWLMMPWPGTVVTGTEYRRVAFVPHPSGLNRWWNDADNRLRARKFFNRLATGAWTP